MRRMLVVSLFSCLTVLALHGVAWASAGEFAEAQEALDGIRVLMWATVVMVLVGVMVMAVLKLGGREWIDALKTAGVVVVLGIIVGVPFIRVLAPIMDEASAATPEDLSPPAIEFVLEGDV